MNPRGRDVNVNVATTMNILGPGQEAQLSIDIAFIKKHGIQVLYESQDGRHFATVMEPAKNETFLRQNTFEIDAKGGWQSQPAVPPAAEC
jgi:hypothetical protein